MRKRLHEGVLHISKNTFAITICGKTVEHSFSPASEGRSMQANKVRYIVENHGNCIDIKLQPQKGKTFLSGIKVRRLSIFKHSIK